MSAATARRRARERVLLGLYERQIARNADDAIAADLFEPPASMGEVVSIQGGGTLPIDTDYGRELWRGVSAEYDALLQASSRGSIASSKRSHRSSARCSSSGRGN